MRTSTVLLCLVLLLVRRNHAAKTCKKELPNGMREYKVVSDKSNTADGDSQSRMGNPVTGLAIGKLLDEAKEYRAPFIKTALDRLHNQIFGTGRATRCTDVVIYNKLDYNFKLSTDGCSSGTWSNSLFPEYEIPAHSSVVYGAESNGFLTGLRTCKATYISTDAAKVQFIVAVSNPYVGPNDATITCPFSKIKPYVQQSQGVANQVRYILDKPESPDLPDFPFHLS